MYYLFQIKYNKQNVIFIVFVTISTGRVSNVSIELVVTPGIVTSKWKAINNVMTQYINRPSTGWRVLPLVHLLNLYIQHNALNHSFIWLVTTRIQPCKNGIRVSYCFDVGMHFHSGLHLQVFLIPRDLWLQYTNLYLLGIQELDWVYRYHQNCELNKQIKGGTHVQLLFSWKISF
jgi:hypothetical protein